MTERVLAHAFQNGKKPPKLHHMMEAVNEQFEVDVSIQFALGGTRLSKLSTKVNRQVNMSPEHMRSSVDAVQTNYMQDSSEKDQIGNSSNKYSEPVTFMINTPVDAESRQIPFKKPAELATPKEVEEKDEPK